MREVNFSVPNINKASVGITTGLYDRRALDCTSTLPLINSLTHLVYLTTSSARIRDILTVDGGVERLVCILKQGRSKDLMNLWMWNLAFQCVVNIGVRGSESVRTRVVEADIVPVIATILDNYIQVHEKYKSKNDANARKHATVTPQRLRTDRPPSGERPERPNNVERIYRRHAPPSIEIPLPIPQTYNIEIEGGETNPTNNVFPPSSRHQHDHLRNHAARPHIHFRTPLRSQNGLQPINGPLSATMDMVDGFGLRPVRDVDRLPSMLPGVQTGGPSQPGSPTTPMPPLPAANSRTSRRSGRPSIRHQRSMSGESDDANTEEIATNISNETETGTEPIVDIQATIDVRSMDDREAILEGVDAPMGAGTEAQEPDTFNITHRSVVDGSLLNPTTTTNPNIGFSPVPPTTVPSVIPPPNYPRFLTDNHPLCQTIIPTMPREEDVLFSLQLLAYVSKYCNLRTYFQKSHLVPTLSISNEIHLLDEDPMTAKQNSPPLPVEEEYLMPDDYNIFPLVEKFTVRNHLPEMQYWAGVVMRNLCRKDDSRGGIRQCAYYECGKWEEYTRQFAKCRRCRRTKYCSKECQKSAWVYHRHWCVAATTQ